MTPFGWPVVPPVYVMDTTWSGGRTRTSSGAGSNRPAASMTSVPTSESSGGTGPNVRKRVAEWGDGWMPIGLSPADLRGAREEIATLARAKGRDPKRLTYTMMIGALPGMEEPALEMLPGKDVLAAYGEAGADRVVVSVPTLGRDGMLAHLDRVAAAAA